MYFIMDTQWQVTTRDSSIGAHFKLFSDQTSTQNFSKSWWSCTTLHFQSPRHKNPIARENQDLKLSSLLSLVCLKRNQKSSGGNSMLKPVRFLPQQCWRHWGRLLNNWIQYPDYFLMRKRMQPCISLAASDKEIANPSSGWHLPSRLASHGRKVHHSGWICRVENQVQSSDLHTRWQDSSCLQ